ncbi:response regulator [Desulforamulus hydrothermalis]|uniref:Stage 0 sporulation protein A homolog n=1 Tax=Desulforamulus hydrothermalis Lam5 = DSM 18033 TaxID=1121428 RepID=K8DYU9_9FIRM|nr:response regulator [Desulforamulus hydrothermalis]CCO08084.1 Response regulator receiver protein [Desulforamulus hydrothermalis Lam5 = DSM 18033]SHG82367.1 two-component system, response regulator, stage 0 sporulation protein F [Desulforamulus hydrothermalis Lam5 = DSM 18033]
MKKTLDVLVVDDQVGVRYLLEIIALEAGHRVQSAQNGLEAIEKVRLHKPDLVFMDVRMPIMGGLEALTKITKMAPGTAVVIMTAYGAEETAAVALQKGAYLCMSKPFDLGEVKKLLQDFAGRLNCYQQSCAESFA